MLKRQNTEKEENLPRKRRKGTLEQQPQPAVNVPQFDEKLSVESLAATKYDVWSNEAALQLGATVLYRKRPPLSEGILCGVVPRFLEFLARDDCPPLQFEATWALANIVSRTAVNTNLVQNTLPAFLKLLKSPIDYVREQAVWALGNIIGHSPQSRELALSYGVLEDLLAQINDQARSHMLRYGTWTLSKLCCGNPRPQYEQVRPMLPTLTQLMIRSTDDEVVKHACWALSYLSEGKDINKIQALIEAGVCPRLVELLKNYKSSIVFPALRTAGNIVTGDDVQTQHIIDLGFLWRLRNLLINKNDSSIKTEACWTISNITAGTRNQIQDVLKLHYVRPLVYLLENAEFDVKREAAWAITNATTGGTEEQINVLVDEGCIKPMCDLLRSCPDPTIVKVCLAGLENILIAGEPMNNEGSGEKSRFCQIIEAADGLDKIRSLLEHDDKKIHNKAVDILNTYWS